MRIALSAALFASTISTGSAFAVGGKRWGRGLTLFSTVEDSRATEASPAAAIIHEEKSVVRVINVNAGDENNDVAVNPMGLTSSEIKARLDAQLGRLREKDATSAQIRKEDIQVVFEDDHIVVINKPSGVLTVSPHNEFPCLAQAVREMVDSDLASADRMVVHRLGMETSGLIVFAKTKEAVRGMNTVFRNRGIERKYEALVCGMVEKEQGFIDLPIMRDYEYPPFVRISTHGHQQVLATLDPEVVGKKLLELPKESITKYQVISREEFDGQPVTRVSLTSISGRYHQLNVHMAAFGHPIVGDTTYGINGLAAPNGGLLDDELQTLIPNTSRASMELQQAISKVATVSCVHAKSLKFRHPVSDEEIALTCDAPW